MPIVFQSEASIGQEDPSVLDEERERHRKRYQLKFPMAREGKKSS